jgi:hypothetical protein
VRLSVGDRFAEGPHGIHTGETSSFHRHYRHTGGDKLTAGGAEDRLTSLRDSLD